MPQTSQERGPVGEAARSSRRGRTWAYLLSDVGQGAHGHRQAEAEHDDRAERRGGGGSAPPSKSTRSKVRFAQ